MRLVLICAAIAIITFAGTPAKADPPRVIASIAPLHSLVANVMAGVGEPDLILSGPVSPHDFALTPSDARRIAAADLVIWIGAPLESFLVKPLDGAGERQLALLTLPAVDAMPFDAGDDGGDTAGIDPHIWLDPVRAIAIVTAVEKRLSEIDPENANIYRANAAALSARLAALDEAIRARLQPNASRPFIAFHDAYGYFSRRYGLRPAGHFAVDPQRRPGARTIARLAGLVSAGTVACAFVEPQFDARIVTAIAADWPLRFGRLDPLGVDLEPGPALYETLLKANTEAIADCLGGSG
ncbi:MAG: zinc ABC transporter substrate-binding protein [Hyphomicrobiales bacterium]|nr:zinc ABC transporter substrate-binding protein [Hyphomicrobiales bacterium]